MWKVWESSLDSWLLVCLVADMWLMVTLISGDNLQVSEFCQVSQCLSGRNRIKPVVVKQTF